MYRVLIVSVFAILTAGCPPSPSSLDRQVAEAAIEQHACSGGLTYPRNASCDFFVVHSDGKIFEVNLITNGIPYTITADSRDNRIPEYQPYNEWFAGRYGDNSTGDGNRVEYVPPRHPRYHEVAQEHYAQLLAASVTRG